MDQNTPEDHNNLPDPEQSQNQWMLAEITAAYESVKAALLRTPHPRSKSIPEDDSKPADKNSKLKRKIGKHLEAKRKQLSPELPVGAMYPGVGFFEDRWDDKPTPERPYPVIMIHGTTSHKNVWQYLANRLRADGYAVFAPDYGQRATQEITHSAQQLDAYIRQVMHATGADKVDIVAHSQGALLMRYWMQRMGGGDLVHHLVSLSGTHHGTQMLGSANSVLVGNTAKNVGQSTTKGIWGDAGIEQIVGSEFLNDFLQDPDTLPGVNYTCFITTSDVVVVPGESGFLEQGPDSHVVNFTVQDSGATGIVRHEEMPYNLVVNELVHRSLNAVLEGEEPQLNLLEDFTQQEDQS